MVEPAERRVGRLGVRQDARRRKVDDLFSLELRDHAGAAKRAELARQRASGCRPRRSHAALSKLLLDFGTLAVRGCRGLRREPVARLSPVALMRVRSWAGARTGSKVKLPTPLGLQRHRSISARRVLVALGRRRRPKRPSDCCRRKDGLLTAGTSVKALASGNSQICRTWSPAIGPLCLTH